VANALRTLRYQRSLTSVPRKDWRHEQHISSALFGVIWKRLSDEEPAPRNRKDLSRSSGAVRSLICIQAERRQSIAASPAPIGVTKIT
jgi:hypothetical protein